MFFYSFYQFSHDNIYMQLRQYQAAHVVLVIVKWLTVDGVIGYKSMWDRKLPFSDRH